jgi:hypothetical protein
LAVYSAANEDFVLRNVNEFAGGSFPLLSEEGWLRGSTKCCEASKARADGVVIKIQHFVPHHPVCGASERDHLLMPQPSLLGEEGKTLACSIPSDEH